MDGKKFRHVRISFNRDNDVIDITTEWDTKDYLTASEILAEQKADPEDREWEPVGKERISRCCTASYQRFKNGCSIVLLNQVAGHGAWVVWEAV